MYLRKIQFPVAIAASGAMGNFGEGYWYSNLEKYLGILNIKGLGFVSKTATLNPRKGNTPFVYDEDYFSPAEIKPKSIKVDLINKNVLNAVGLGNPGLEAFLKTGHWQNEENPFWISIMSIAATAEERKQEMEAMVNLLLKEKPNFKASFGLQINLSCPNTGHDTCGLSEEANEMVNIAAKLDVPIMAKFSIASVSIDALMELEKNEHLDAICVSNTIPYGWIPNMLFQTLALDWKNIFGLDSPLKKMGGGGLSGDAIKPFVLHFISSLKSAGFKKHINGGGGIMEASDVDIYKKAGADSIFFGSVVMVRPYKVKGIIDRANEIF
jgi:dihydroorotate dehydrogenase